MSWTLDWSVAFNRGLEDNSLNSATAKAYDFDYEVASPRIGSPFGSQAKGTRYFEAY